MIMPTAKRTLMGALLGTVAWSSVAIAAPHHHMEEDAGSEWLWSNVESWNGSVPGPNDTIIIPAGETVVIDQSPAPLGTLVVHGTLHFAAEQPINLSADNIVVFGAMEAQRDERGVPITITLTGEISDLDPHLGHLAPPHGHTGHHGGGHGHMGPVANKVLVVAPGGHLTLDGADMTSWSELGTTAPAGASTIELAGTPTGWRPGDLIAIASTSFSSYETEERRITSIDGNKISLNQPLNFKHFGEIQQLTEDRSLDMRAEVANLSRSVSVVGERSLGSDNSGVGQDPQDLQRRGYGGHVVILPGATAHIDGAAFESLGNSGLVGSYPVHFHHTGDASDSFIRNSSVHHSYQRGIVVHKTQNLTLEGNVVYDTMSHSFYIEDGDETENLFQGNLAMLPQDVHPSVRIDNPSSRHGRERERASAYWITNADNRFIDNHAVAVPDGMGFWFIGPDNGSGTAVFKGNKKNNTILAEFTGNTAHTIGTKGGNAGYRLQWRGVALEFGSGVAQSTAHAPVVDFTAWKVGNMAMQVAPNKQLTYIRPTLAESRVFFQSASRAKNGDTDLIVQEPIIIGETINPDPTPIGHRFGKKAPGPLLHESERPLVLNGGGSINADMVKDTKRKDMKGSLQTNGFAPLVVIDTPLPDPDPTPDPIDPIDPPTTGDEDEPSSGLTYAIVNTGTGEVYTDVKNGQTIRTKSFRSRRVALQVGGLGTLQPASVRFRIDGKDYVDNTIPFSSFGDRSQVPDEPHGKKRAFDKPAYEIEIEFFDGPSGTGQMIGSDTLRFKTRR